MPKFAKSVEAMRSSEIRKLMGSASDPNMISFAGGMPNNDLFPVNEVNQLYNELPDSIKKVGFQYGPTPGYPPLLATVKELLRKKGLPVDNDRLMITTGSMQAISIVSKVFIDPGDIVITEYPCFVGGIAAFKANQANIKSVPMDADGMIMSELKKVVESAERKPKLLYLSPYFHNPAGIVYSKKRKQELIDYLKDKDIVLLEDDPYCEFYFHDEDKELMAPMKSVQPELFPICYTGTLSKTFGPGMRIGWLLTPPDIYDKAEIAKQAFDACSSTFTQVLANEFIRRGMMDKYVANLRVVYKRRMEITIEALNKYMPEGVKWVDPRGGFYVWLTLPENIDATQVLEIAIKNGALFVIGKTFDPEGLQNNSLRLAYSYPSEEKLEQGVKIIADAIKEVM